MFRNRYFWLLISLFFVLKTEAKVTPVSYTHLTLPTNSLV